MKTVRSILVLGMLAFAVQACASTAVVVTGKEVVIYLSACNGTQPFTFQWQKNGANISGATGVAVPSTVTGTAIPNSAFVIASFAAADAGSYTCVVSNAGGHTTSDIATLTALIGPGGAVTGVQVTENGKTTVIPFT